MRNIYDLEYIKDLVCLHVSTSKEELIIRPYNKKFFQSTGVFTLIDTFLKRSIIFAEISGQVWTVPNPTNEGLGGILSINNMLTSPFPEGIQIQAHSNVKTQEYIDGDYPLKTIDIYHPHDLINLASIDIKDSSGANLSITGVEIFY